MIAIRKKINNFCARANQKWIANNRNRFRFEKNEKVWLSGMTELTLIHSDVSIKKGRPSVGYSEGSVRQKRKLASVVSSAQGNDTKLLLHAASIAAQSSKENDLNFVLKKAVSSPTRPTKIRQMLSCDDKKPIMLSPEEALLFLIENNLTKQQYINIRELNKSHNCDIFPSYPKIQEYKLQCRPEGLSVTDSLAEIPLQNLVNHTAKRILSYQEEVLLLIPELNEVTLVLSYGFDGSTGQSSFKQMFNSDSPESLDSSLFVTSVIPLKLISSNNAIVWKNRTPQSVRFCRPLKIEFIKETKEHILKEKHNIDLQISNLEHLEYSLSNGKIISVKYELIMTLIDGKVLNVLTGTKSSQSCPICGANPKQFLLIKDLNSSVFQPKLNTLKYGISPLHAWIRCLEFVLNLSYRLPVKKWQIRNAQDKSLMQQRKRKIQEQFWNKMGLHVHKPKSNGSGTTNDGENASEARNKFYKKDRIEHARKDSRVHNITDVFNRAMDSSDPLLSSIYIKKRHSAKRKLQLPREVISLLKIPEVPEYQLPSTSSATENETFTDSEEEQILPVINLELEIDEMFEDFELE
ncbi:uncharacterized protein LOC124420131 [Lucilia cuprina]|uniref:uncharacterized protein LOC124420131 n=1 Tax=Lucilia cuprina TaxID=7375 RepID=UPI001F058E74|nr:uncharacterized protein LOC124420131 [Lucilia cuprina]